MTIAIGESQHLAVTSVSVNLKEVYIVTSHMGRQDKESKVNYKLLFIRSCALLKYEF